MRGGWYSFESRYIKNIPMPTPMESKELEEAVQMAISSGGFEGELKAKIDQLVYKLYELSDEDIRIVEGREQ
jgi:hypothetical protein